MVVVVVVLTYLSDNNIHNINSISLFITSAANKLSTRNVGQCLT